MFCVRIKSNYICCCRIFLSCSTRVEKCAPVTIDVSLQSTELAFLCAWPIRKVFYMKVADVSELHIPYNIPLFCIMSCFEHNNVWC